MTFELNVYINKSDSFGFYIKFLRLKKKKGKKSEVKAGSKYRTRYLSSEGYALTPCAMRTIEMPFRTDGPDFDNAYWP